MHEYNNIISTMYYAITTLHRPAGCLFTQLIKVSRDNCLQRGNWLPMFQCRIDRRREKLDTQLKCVYNIYYTYADLSQNRTQYFHHPCHVQINTTDHNIYNSITCILITYIIVCIYTKYESRILQTSFRLKWLL